MASTRLLLQIGPALLGVELSDASLIELLQDYRAFSRTSGEGDAAPLRFRFFVDEREVEGWRDTEEILSMMVWRLRRRRSRTFIVGTFRKPPQPYWVAASDSAYRSFDIARLPLGASFPARGVLEPALRILPRLALMHHLLEPPTGMLVHAAGAVVDRRILLFPGQSGAGKSTISRRLSTHGGAEVVNDDRMLLTTGGDGWIAWGTPWPGELGIALDRHAPLASLVFLEKSDRTRVEALAPRDALARLVPMASIPWYDQSLVPRSLDLLERLVQQVPAHVLHFRPDASAADAVMELGRR